MDKDTVNNFNCLDEFLSLSKGDDANLSEVIAKAAKAATPDAPAKKPKPKTTSRQPSQLSADQIKETANNPHFQYDYPNPSMETGSDAHIEYLTFRLGSNPTEFGKKPLSLYLGQS